MYSRLFLVSICIGFTIGLAQGGRTIKCKFDNGTFKSCMTEFENIAFGRDIRSNDTCGSNEQSEYCIPTFRARKMCAICDSKYPRQAHTTNLMTDHMRGITWWQSDTLLENKHGIYLILDLKKKYTVAFIRISFHSIRPHSFAIYKKSTYGLNEKWQPYQYYSSTCKETYGISPRVQVTYENQKVALCTDSASDIIPLSRGNVVYSTLDFRPGNKDIDRYPELQDWVTMTSLKFSLDRLNTFGDEVSGDPKVLKSYYFAISDIDVGGRCECNGHASKCPLGSYGRHYCECEHNTTGQDCEVCLPLYNDLPWKKASRNSANACQTKSSKESN